MIDPDRIDRPVAALEDLMRDRLGLRGAFAVQISRARRSLPGPMRRAGHRIAHAKRLSAHPKLARLVPRVEFDADAAALQSHLKEIDPAQRRRGTILALLGGIVFNLMILGVLLSVLLYWRGFF
ncbi:hypothetical protein [Roseovarius sp. TE539]|uniref:hypothetical protein n=1 Tax=Roseovarius sp. TE539 TaxID=2249812 RepID=UPI0011BF939D|nr:hypothetical protein [Roseovarius sp. TE539]